MVYHAPLDQDAHEEYLPPDEKMELGDKIAEICNIHHIGCNLPKECYSECGKCAADEIVKLIEQALEKAIFDNRAGKQLDLPERLFELFWMIYNDGVRQEYEPVQLEALTDEEIDEIMNDILAEDWEKGRHLVEATIAKNQKEQLYRKRK